MHHFIVIIINLDLKTYTTNNGLERINSRHSTGKNKATSSSSSTSRDTRWSLLKQLTISETSISSVNRQSFKNLTNLVKLNLSSNLLESVPEGLEQLTNLRYLNLADNKITNLKGVENIISLIKLDIRKNPIKNLQPLIKLATKTQYQVYISSASTSSSSSSSSSIPIDSMRLLELEIDYVKS